LEKYLTIGELAEHLRLRPQTIRRWVQTDGIPYRRIRASIRFRVSEIEKWVEGGGMKTGNDETDGLQVELFQNGEPEDAGE